MRELSVYVTGIAAFVEDYRRVVAVDASHPVTMTVAGERGQSNQVTVPGHFPYLRMPFDHIEDPENYAISHDWDTSAAPGVFPDPEGDNIQPSLLKFLHYQEVVLPDSTTPASVDMTPLNATGLPIKNQDDASVLWLPTMESLGTPARTIDPKHVVANPTEIAAYIRFPNGRMTTAFPTQFKFVSVSAADGKAAGTLNRAVAQLVVCKMDVPDEAFTVVCRDYQAGGGSGDFNVNFKAGMAEPWMVFACTSLEDAFQLPTVDEKFGIDLHFRLVYSLAQGTVTEADIALPKSINPGPGVPRPLGAGKCVPPLFSGGGTGGKN